MRFGKSIFSHYCILILCLLFCGCEQKVGNPSTLNISATTTISMMVVNISDTQIELELENHSEDTLYWGTWYVLEKNIEGTWYEVEMELPEGVSLSWHAIQYSLAGGEKQSLDYSLEFYENLSQGNYRIVKDFSFDEKNQEEKFYVACEFEIK